MKNLKLLFALLILSNTFLELAAQTQTLLKLQDIPFEFHKISDIRNGYPIQSNGSPQQLWMDPDQPDFLHAVFMNSQSPDPPWADRTCIYFGSTDFGVTWFQLGSVPDTSRSGFPAITGTVDGAGVITNHSEYFGLPRRTGLFIDEGPFHYNFTAYNPDSLIATTWPKCFSIPGNKILITATVPLPQISIIMMNIFDIYTGTFFGWSPIISTNSQFYSLCVSDAGKIGFAIIESDMEYAGDVFYFESTDNGMTWSAQIKIFDCPAEQGIAVGALRGISLNFLGENPCVVFETSQQDFNQPGGPYYPLIPNQILFWSPNVNGGIAKVIADSSNVPFYPALNTVDHVFPPLCRPVIGRTEFNEYLFVAFSGSTENIYVGFDSTTYFAGYITYSTDGGETWSDPEKFTPDTPLLDWKYISTTPVYDVFLVDPIGFTLHYVLQADTLKDSPNPQFLSAQYYHASFTYITPSVGDEGDINNYLLEQNYPNPFNPVTTIKYSIPSSSFVQLKVYDVLGNEIATLVNEEKPAGRYETEFIGTDFPSGVYFYQLNSGEFAQTKKMILLK